tara:strand:- start:833 stop:1846 length:1014 start_codon:yes stop_codon:yes gene_type:complete
MNIDDKRVVITGGTGSFGSTMVKRLIKDGVGELIVFSRDEKKQDDMRQSLIDHDIKFVIGDTRNIESCNNVLKGADLVFHAAALKQVPSCEFYPYEAVKTNIDGSNNIINASIQNNVSKLVILSTDKAVMPINAMGISKAMMEKIAIANARYCRDENINTKICVTRYGNVMSSRGSVIPKFISLINNNQPLTVTDYEMTRFMMSLNDSVELVLHAFENSNGGETYIQKADAANIKTLISAIEILTNKTAIIEVTGPRHGEKYHETLATAEELSKCNETKKYFEISPDLRDLRYSQANSSNQKEKIICGDFSSDVAKQLNPQELANKIIEAGINISNA